jgi:hypothetical protein
VAENCVGSAGEDGCHPAPFQAEDLVPNGVDPTMEVVPCTALDPSRDLVPADAKSDQLPASDHTMLTLGEPPDRSIHSRHGPGN